MGTFPGFVAMRELLAHGMRALAARMFHEEARTAAEARTFAKEFEGAIAKLVAKRADPATMSQGARWKPVWDPELKKWDHDFQPGFEESVAILGATARWYERVGRRGFGVSACW